MAGAWKGGQVYELQDHMLHAKMAVIDHCLSIVGSYNLDMRSFLHAEEVSAVIKGEKTAGRLNAMFQKDIAAQKKFN